MLNLRFLVLLPLALAACSTPAEPPPLAGAKIGGPFSLVDQNGRATTDATFSGKWRIMYFGYTFCPDVCPVDVANLVGGYRAFAKASPERAARLIPIFVSVDPARDTPSVLKTWAAAFDPRLIALTGTPAQLKAITQAYGAVFQIMPPAKGAPADAYLVDHSRGAYLMDPAGKPIALLSQDEKPAVIAAELERWVK